MNDASGARISRMGNFSFCLGTLNPESDGRQQAQNKKVESMIRFSKATQSMRASAIRELMGVATRPDMISFAGGMPGNSLFPVAELDGIYSRLSLEAKQTAFQYGPTPGYPPLIESLKEYLSGLGLPLKGHDVIITTGALQAINLTAKVLIDPGDAVITEQPTFVGGIAAFKSYQAVLAGVPMDEDGIRMDALDKAWKRLSRKPKMMYVIPNFHNPAGILYSRRRRLELIDFLKTHRTVLLEDDAYHELYFEEKDRETVRPIKSLADQNMPIVYAGSFSKIFGPGMRLGWLLSPVEIHAQCELAKQSVDACSPTFTQVLADRFLREGHMQRYLSRIRPEYTRRAAAMLNSLSRHMPDGVSWTKPRGGFYVWVTLPKHVDATDVLKASLQQGAVIVVGKTFDPRGRQNGCMRLAFSHAPEEKIEEGVKIIANVLRRFV
jgi:2-aminoadipate transaminase